MTLEEAEWISRNRLPGEPGSDELAAWRASRPPPEPTKRAQRLDTAPAPQIDWSTVIRQTILGERAHMSEAIGQAIAEYDDSIIGEVERMIALAISELRAEFAGQLEQLANEIAGSIDLVHTQGSELKAQLEQIIARKRRAPKAAKANGDTRPSLLQLPKRQRQCAPAMSKSGNWRGGVSGPRFPHWDAGAQRAAAMTLVKRMIARQYSSLAIRRA